MKNKWQVRKINDRVSVIELETPSGTMFGQCCATNICTRVSNPAGVIRALVEDMLRASKKQEIAI